MPARPPRWAALAVAASLAAVGLTACGGGASESGGGGSDSPVADLAGPVEFATPAAGGTYRMAQTDFGFSDAFDPSGEYVGTSWEVYNSLLLRTLVGFPLTAGPEGNELIPDLATEVPEPTAGGTVYEFTIRDGAKFGPPLSRQITSEDVAYAFERIATPSVAAQYGFYYSVIEGFDDFAAGKADSISGIATPDERTVRFTLTEPTGDFLFRLTLPATGPIPPEVGGCHEQAGEYGRYLISSGPYMYEGSEDLDASSCATQKPISGFNPTSRMSLVRNPDWDPASAVEGVRPAYPDAFLFTINTNEKDIFQKIQAGELESSFDAPPPAVLRDYVRGDADRERLRVNQADKLWFIYMNMTQPPFDDVHVRRAMNMAMDLDGLRRAWGGPVAGEIATDVIPDQMLGGALTSATYQPFQSEPFTGDVEKAKEEMTLSAYDTDKDGVCDAKACEGLLHVTNNFGPWKAMAPVIQQSAASIGVDLDIRELPQSAAFAATGTVAREVPSASSNGWAKDYSDASTYMVLFDGRNIIPTGNTNEALVGLTAAQAKDLGVPYPTGGVPSVDADIDACNALTAPQERLECWTALSRKVTEEVVPWIPYLDATNIELLGPAVTAYDFDQAAGEPALAKVAVDPSLQK